MSKLKTEFELQFGNGEKHKYGEIKIIGAKPNHNPYVAMYLIDNTQSQSNTTCWIKDKDLERFAVNILKALKSKHLKQ